MDYLAVLLGVLEFFKNFQKLCFEGIGSWRWMSGEMEHDRRSSRYPHPTLNRTLGSHGNFCLTRFQDKRLIQNIKNQIVLFFKDFIYLFLDRGKEREEEGERNINVWLPLMCPQLGTWPANQACALTGNQTGDPLVRRPVLNLAWAISARAQIAFLFTSSNQLAN